MINISHFDFILALINVPSLRHSLNEHWDQALPISLYYDHHNLTRQQEITELINRFYFNNQKLVEKTERNLTNVRISLRGGESPFLSYQK